MSLDAGFDIDHLLRHVNAWIEVNAPFELTPAAIYAAKFIAFNPIFWNLAAHLELRLGAISKLTGDKYRGCYLLAIAIFSLGIFRDLAYHAALAEQPVAPILDTISVSYLGIALIGIGNILVLSSMWALGITGTYLGDYFGILMEKRVTGFPFNVTNNPMYVGSYLSFMGYALYSAKAIGVILSIAVWIMYSIALQFEEPYTAEIYAQRDRLREAEKNKKEASEKDEKK